ncbi:poly(ADP-ribose) glycohydrolase [Synchiropus splendidus]|uniref:poly(ADP-ribose) glycohydrolase n=1 Tax=Synchiropus splendidus TaxID=270530 RepID=UPI00237DC711|nr:poly(ADP-ribose) glycohydrolase [Synchiropus splendidus]
MPGRRQHRQAGGKHASDGTAKGRGESQVRGGASGPGHLPPVTRTGSSSCRLEDLKRLQNKRRLYCSWNHTVLIDVARFNRGGGIAPHIGRRHLDGDVVEMPNSPSSFVESDDKKQREKRWQVISEQLTSLTFQREATVSDLQGAIFTYNRRQQQLWTFKTLSSFVQRNPHCLTQLFPKIAALALSLPERLNAAVPLLRRGSSASITLSQMQVAALLANAFYCTFPDRSSNPPSARYRDLPSINFNSLFGDGPERKTEKLRAIMQYFSVVTDPVTQPEGLVTFERRCLRDEDLPDWRSCTQTLSRLHVSSLGSIEAEGVGLLQVDFASCWVGGGVLGSGLLQEEILFLLSPELIVARLFTERLEDLECLIVTGCEQFSHHDGYGDSFRWAGPHQDQVLRDDWCRRHRKIVAIDALNYGKRQDQFTMESITRELNKAFCGFKASRYDRYDEPDIATGKWGCGAFNGDAQLKALIQLMAAAVAKRNLAFFTFGDQQLQQQLEEVYHLLVLERVTVGSLAAMLEEFCSSYHATMTLFDFIKTDRRYRHSQL